MGALAELARFLAKAKDLEAVRNLMEPRVKVRSGVPIDQQIIANELMRNMEFEPQAQTHIFHDGNKANAAYQLITGQHVDGSYIPYLVSFEKGLGHQALEDAYQQAKSLQPHDPVFLYSTMDPDTLQFYRNQPSWIESQDEGVSKFTRKSKGGLIQMRECSCGKTR